MNKKYIVIKASFEGIGDDIFETEEIKTMLEDYIKETSINMEVELLAKEIRSFTSGYPYLVSRLCKNIDEYLDKDWTLEGLTKAIKMTLNEPNTLFDDVVKILKILKR